MLAFEAEIVSDHGDELTVRRLSLNPTHGISEEPLQRLHVAAVPGDLYCVADFQGFALKDFARSLLYESEVIYWLVHWLYGLCSLPCANDSKSQGERQERQSNEHSIILCRGAS